MSADATGTMAADADRGASFWRDVSIGHAANGLVGFLFAASGPLAIVLAAGTKGGLSEADLASLGVRADLVAEVARLVRMTVEHDPAAGDRNGEVLCDADLAVLAAAPAQYRHNSAAIRAEYAHVPEDVFRAGRAHIIEALLAGPALYRTPIARKRWEQAARANLVAELQTLTGPKQGH